MEFEGHQLHRIDRCWVFDLTTFIGYRVKTKGDKVEYISKAFVVIRDKKTGNYMFDRSIEVPVKVLRKTVNIIRRYRKEALLENEYK